MQMEKLEHFKKKLINEREKVNDLLNLMVKNETIDSKSEISSELSYYDNHPSDIATEINDIEKGMAFRENEKSIIRRIDDALTRIEDESYGKCKSCGEAIDTGRLEFMPYAENCVKCENKINNLKQREIHDRPVEEKVIGHPFGKDYRHQLYSSEFDSEDSYESVEAFNKMENIVEIYDYEDQQGYVEPIEKISNDQYKSQLPD
ncbi:TraR/DksA C4-type zinc finger protein [Clostridium pasteurianum]|uniref:Sporulation protein, yteA family n=1 Tax=Clostridium pasteurianum BC1 TaxID=86416 RepID=R4K7M5_CLOPA|nr:TraR/DksA C4-type zinc finger protein [Clostridium pasteurianum]AGK97721.1 sporulation protein, yteA family [Clostridium pasteurianum BC1]